MRIKDLNCFFLSLIGFLRRIGQPHLLYKPVQFGSKGVREVSFYDALYYRKTHLGNPSIFPSLVNTTNTTSTYSLLKSALPMYHGLTTIADRAGHNCILKLMYMPSFVHVTCTVYPFIHICIYMYLLLYTLTLQCMNQVFKDRQPEQRGHLYSSHLNLSQR